MLKTKILIFIYHIEDFMNSGLEKHEKFHVIIFMLVFVYFYVLKITNHVEISWVALVFPLILGIVLFYLIRYIKNKA